MDGELSGGERDAFTEQQLASKEFQRINASKGVVTTLLECLLTD